MNSGRFRRTFCDIWNDKTGRFSFRRRLRSGQIENRPGSTGFCLGIGTALRGRWPLGVAQCDDSTPKVPVIGAGAFILGIPGPGDRPTFTGAHWPLLRDRVDVVLGPATERDDAEATPSTGSETLFDFYARLIKGEVSVERGDHAVL